MNYQTIGVFGKYQDDEAAGHVAMLAKFLKNKSLEVLVGDETGKHSTLDVLGLERLEAEAIAQRADLAIVVGGDGTLLGVARCLAHHQVPLIGVNLGRLGFLTDVPVKTMQADIEKILQGDHATEDRLMLLVEIIRDDNTIASAHAVNDVVIARHNADRLISWKSYVDGKLVTSARSDGVIVSTPTGSTAYAMSAGGPILDPELDAVALVPICPHTLSNRPIALRASSIIEFSVSDSEFSDAHVSADGQIVCNLDGDELIRVSRSEHTVKLIKMTGSDHYSMLRAKLGWGSS